MAVIRVKLIGAGTQKDPYRAPLPSYTELLTNFTEGWVLANVPDTDLHRPAAEIDGNAHETSSGPHILKMSDTDKKNWHAYLDDKYREHAGKFKPEVV